MTPIVYIHGFNSSARSHKAALLQARMAVLGRERNCHIPELPADPRMAMGKLEALLEGLPDQRACLVGSSLGGYYATYLSEHNDLPAVLLNPAVRPYELLMDYLGEQVNPYTGEHYTVGEEFIDILKAYDINTLSKPGNFLVFLETGDEVLDYRQAETRFRDARLEIFRGGSHEMVNFESRLDDILHYCDCTFSGSDSYTNEQA